MDCLNSRYYKDSGCCGNILEIKPGTLYYNSGKIPTVFSMFANDGSSWIFFTT